MVQTRRFGLVSMSAMFTAREANKIIHVNGKTTIIMIIKFEVI